MAALVQANSVCKLAGSRKTRELRTFHLAGTIIVRQDAEAPDVHGDYPARSAPRVSRPAPGSCWPLTCSSSKK
jgi:hypothetical protein